MIELPEARIIKSGLSKEIKGKKIVNVLGNFDDHKFTFYYNDPSEYKKLLINKRVTNVIPRNFYIEIEIEDYLLTMRDGTNIRYYEKCDIPKKSKLLLEFEDGTFLNVTVAMYGFICVFKKSENMDDPYYDMELSRVGVLDKEYTFNYFKSLIDDKSKKLSAKAFLATEQRILGIGNGVVQDILFNARIHPKKKIKDLTDEQIKKLYESTKSTINEMIKKGGRDTEKDIYGNFGGYKTKFSNKSYKNDKCPSCKGDIKKENYLGGSIYYCPVCQQ